MIKAKEEGFIAEVKPFLQKLVTDAGFRLNPKLIERIVEIVKEN